MFQPVLSYSNKSAISDNISVGKSKRLSEESIKSPVASSNSSATALNYINTEIWLKFDGSCLRWDKVTFTHKSG